jgi:uncharacterized protein (TIGR02217 family)
MGFVDVQFPADISYGSSGGPVYDTDIVITQSGFEQRNINWQQARARYNVAHGVKTQAQLDALIAFFRARKGRAIGFRFKDWTDYKATSTSLGTGDGVQSRFVLQKIYSSGGQNEIRRITKPVVSSAVIRVNGVTQGANVSVNYTNGEVVFLTPPANGAAITADFEFDVPVRFDVDTLSATIDAYGVHSWQDIALIEVRVGNA